MCLLGAGLSAVLGFLLLPLAVPARLCGVSASLLRVLGVCCAFLCCMMLQLGGARLVCLRRVVCEQFATRIIVSRSFGPKHIYQTVCMCVCRLCAVSGHLPNVCHISCQSACLLACTPRVCVRPDTHACILPSLYPHVHVYCLFGSRAHPVVMPWLHGRWCVCVRAILRERCARAALLFGGRLVLL